jgi:hypothetical protein
MNDSDIRGLLNASANSQMTFSSFYGASSAWSTTGTVGGYSSKFGSSYAYTNQTGGTVSLGSIVDPTIDKLNGAIINRATEAYANTIHSINFGFYSKADPFSNPLGTNEPYVWSGGNSGWSTLTFAGVTLSRTSASFSVQNAGQNRETLVFEWYVSALGTFPITGLQNGSTFNISVS